MKMVILTKNDHRQSSSPPPRRSCRPPGILVKETAAPHTSRCTRPSPASATAATPLEFWLYYGCVDV